MIPLSPGYLTRRESVATLAMAVGLKQTGRLKKATDLKSNNSANLIVDEVYSLSDNRG